MSSQNNDNQQQSTNPVDTMPSILLTDVTDVMKSIIECLEENIEGTDALYSRVVVSRMRGKQELRNVLNAMTKNLETVRNILKRLILFNPVAGHNGEVRVINPCFTRILRMTRDQVGTGIIPQDAANEVIAENAELTRMNQNIRTATSEQTTNATVNNQGIPLIFPMTQENGQIKVSFMYKAVESYQPRQEEISELTRLLTESVTTLMDSTDSLWTGLNTFGCERFNATHGISAAKRASMLNNSVPAMVNVEQDRVAAQQANKQHDLAPKMNERVVNTNNVPYGFVPINYLQRNGMQMYPMPARPVNPVQFGPSFQLNVVSNMSQNQGPEIHCMRNEK